MEQFEKKVMHMHFFSEAVGFNIIRTKKNNKAVRISTFINENIYILPAN